MSRPVTVQTKFVQGRTRHGERECWREVRSCVAGTAVCRCGAKIEFTQETEEWVFAKRGRRWLHQHYGPPAGFL